MRAAGATWRRNFSVGYNDRHVSEWRKLTKIEESGGLLKDGIPKRRAKEGNEEKSRVSRRKRRIPGTAGILQGTELRLVG